MNKKPLPPEITAALTADPLLVIARDLGQIDDADYKSLDEQQRQRAGDQKGASDGQKKRNEDANRTARGSLASRIMRFVTRRRKPASPRRW